MLELSLLGNPTSTIDGRTLANVLLKKQLALLYYLAAVSQPQPRTTLAVLLWGDLEETAAKGNLRKALSDLRRHLGDHLRIERDLVDLVRAQCTVDLWEFEASASAGIDSGDLAQLASAAGLYRGDFLDGFSVRGAVDFDRWVYNTQERLRALAVQVLTTLAAQQAKSSHLTAAIDAQRRVLQLEPWREESHRELMRLLARSGQRSAALAQYEACVESLAHELGVRPDAETTALAEQLRAPEMQPADLIQPAKNMTAPVGHSAPTPAPAQLQRRSCLPPELSPIVGRAAELGELSEMLMGQDCRLVTLLGPGGIGKTRLALALAHRLSGSLDHAAMVSLSNVAAAGEILPMVGRTLGLGQSDASALAAVGSAGSQLLLVLDNFEHLLPQGVEVLEQLLTEAPRLRCVVTSREALKTRWEWRYEIAELGYPADPGNPGTSEYSSVQMFLQMARRTRGRRAVGPHELPHVMRICRLVAGMPLGIELAAAQAGSLPCAVIADQLATSLDRVVVDRRDLPERQRSLWASFETSWASLSPQEQHVLEQLAVIHGEFALDAALAVAAASIVDLVRLVDKSLVRMNSSSRYSIHEVVQRLAMRKLEGTPGASAAAFARYRDFYVNWVDQELHWQTDHAVPLQEAKERMENHLQHLWYLWLNSVDLPQRGDVALALNAVEQRYFGYTEIGRETWIGFSHFVDDYAASPPAHSGVLSIDTIWLPLLAGDLADMTAEFAGEAASILPAVAETCTVEGRMLAYPIDIELGLLYCRRDLLEKYGYSEPPATWDELEAMAAAIQAGERSAGHDDFWGYLWDGHLAEGLTCTALEWQHSEGGGTIVEPDGRISVANVHAAAALARAARWVGTISPPSFRDYSVPQIVRAFEDGDTAFVRLWTTYLAVRRRADIRPLTAVTVLPRGSACHAATLGGRPLVVHRLFRQRKEALALIKEVGSLEAQRTRLLEGDALPPSMVALYKDQAILSLHPHLPEVYRLIKNGGLAVRPTKITGALYPEVSRSYADTAAQILAGEVAAMPALQALEQKLVALGGWPRV